MRSQWLLFHRDERGTITIVSVFAMLLLTMLLGMVMNVGRHVDAKVRMQNTADSAAYAGGVVLARGMNTLAFSNHLLFDVFSMTAFMREAKEGNAAKFVPEILKAWQKVAETFSKASDYEKFTTLSTGITSKVPLEQNLVTGYSEWVSASSAMILPLLEEILSGDLIPTFERAVVLAYPDIAQAAAMEVAKRNGDDGRGWGNVIGVLWRTDGTVVAGTSDTTASVFPVVDTNTEAGANRTKAISQRKTMASQYLSAWNAQTMIVFDYYGKMGQFGSIWRSYTCAQLNKLLSEYPTTNLPFLIRQEADEVTDSTEHLAEHFTYLAVVYRNRVSDISPIFFRNPASGDDVAFAEVRVYVPKRRLVWETVTESYTSSTNISIGGVPGDFQTIPSEESSTTTGTTTWEVARQGTPDDWNLINQSWSAQLVPATHSILATILQTVPAGERVRARGIQAPVARFLDDRRHPEDQLSLRAKP